MDDISFEVFKQYLLDNSVLDFDNSSIYLKVNEKEIFTQLIRAKNKETDEKVLFNLISEFTGISEFYTHVSSKPLCIPEIDKFTTPILRKFQSFLIDYFYGGSETFGYNPTDFQKRTKPIDITKIDNW